MTPAGAVSTASNPVAPELVDRFRAALERLNPSGCKLGLAVSGGPDSMAMLLLAHAAIPGEFEVATVDHGLRPEAKAECALVVAACEARGIPCEVLSVEVGEGNVQEQARIARYAALGEWASRRGIYQVATAHHAEDQAETLLMRLNRGSGIAGLSGIRRATMIGTTHVVRPLLEWRRAELEGVCSVSGVTPVRDPSNELREFERVRMRQAIAEADLLDVAGLARSAQLLSEAKDFVDNRIEVVWLNHVSEVDNGFDFLPGFTDHGNIEISRRILQQMGATPSRAEIARMVRRLWEDKNASLGGVLVKPVHQPDNPRNAPCRKWLFRPEPPRKTG